MKRIVIILSLLSLLFLLGGCNETTTCKKSMDEYYSDKETSNTVKENKTSENEKQTKFTKIELMIN